MKIEHVLLQKATTKLEHALLHSPQVVMSDETVKLHFSWCARGEGARHRGVPVKLDKSGMTIEDAFLHAEAGTAMSWA